MDEIKKCKYQYMKPRGPEIGGFLDDKALWCKKKDTQIIAPIKKIGDQYYRYDWICNTCEEREEE